MQNSDLTSSIIAYEQGDLDGIGILELFADLVANGSAWTLQGSYGRTAKSLIDGGYITPDGDITGWGADQVERPAPEPVPTEGLEPTPAEIVAHAFEVEEEYDANEGTEFAERHPIVAPLPDIDPVETLAEIIAIATTGLHALATEHEGDLRNAVRRLDGKIALLSDLVERW